MPFVAAGPLAFSAERTMASPDSSAIGTLYRAVTASSLRAFWGSAGSPGPQKAIFPKPLKIHQQVARASLVNEGCVMTEKWDWMGLDADLRHDLPSWRGETVRGFQRASRKGIANMHYQCWTVL